MKSASTVRGARDRGESASGGPEGGNMDEHDLQDKKEGGSTAKIHEFAGATNAKSKPFAWTATTDSILEKVEQLCQSISQTEH